MRTSLVAAATVLLFAPGLFAQGSKSIKPTEVTADHLGEDISVEGRVYTAGESNSGVHLYFGADNSSAFQAIILASQLHNFKVDVKKKYSKRNVRVSGTVEEQEGKFYIRVREPKQIKVVPRKRRSSS